MQNWRDTVLSQYANSPKMLALIQSANDALDPSANVDLFYANVWNIQTATGYGLDVWGRIVGISRYLGAPGVYALDDATYRTLILVKALVNIAATTIPTLNNLLSLLFPGQRCYVVDTGNMTMMFTFEFALTSYQLAVVNAPGVLPHPTGVGVFVNQIPANSFGFSEQPGSQPFNQGTFVP